MTKVLIVFHDGDKKSGATASMLDLLTELIKCKDLKIICLIPKYGSLYDELKRLRIKTYVIKYYSGRYSLGSYKGTVWNIIKTSIKQLITFLSFMKVKNKFMNIDVFYTNTSDNYMGLLLSIFLKKKNIFHIREFGLEDQHQKHIITDHLYYSLVNKYANEVIVISEALKNKIIKYITGNNLNLIYDDVHIQNKPMLNYANSARLRKFIIIGTLCEGKGQKIAIEAMHNLIREGYLCHLKIIGNNRVPYASYLNKIVADYNLSDYVEFMGFRHDLDQIRLDNDVCLIPSLSEAFGRVTIESMAAGMIVVASDSGASKEIINDGINGFLFSSGSVSDLTSVLKKILDVESNNLECIRKRALVDSQKYTSGHAASSIYNLIIN